MRVTDEEVQILQDIENLWEQCESSIADLELQEQKLSEEMRRISGGYHGVDLKEMEEMIHKIREVRFSERDYYAQEDVLSNLRGKILNRIGKRTEE